MMAFDDYADFVAATTPEGNSGPARWTEAGLEEGVVEAAMRAVANALEPDFALPMVETEPGILSMSKPVTFHGCRVQVIGTDRMDELPPGLTRECADRAREALTICVLPSAALEIVGLHSEANSDVMTGVISFYPRDIHALATEEVDLVDLIEYKLFRRLLTDRPDAETQFSPRLHEEYRQSGPGGLPWHRVKDAIETRGEDPSEWLPHPGAIDASGLCARGRNVLLIGYSSSGKSVLSFQVGLNREKAGWGVRYANLGEAVGAPHGIISDQLLYEAGADGHPHRMVILDDLQSNPAVARVALSVAALCHRARVGARPVMLAVSWKEFAKEATNWCPDVAPVAVHAPVIRERLLAAYADRIDRETVDALSREIGEDIYLLRLALEITCRERSRPSRGEVAESVWQMRVPAGSDVGFSAGARRVALLAGAVGQFDIHISPELLRTTAQVDRKLILELIELKLLRLVGDNVTLGHRSLCALIVWWLEQADGWEELSAVGGPADVPAAVLLYLESSTAAASIEALRALIARTGFKARGGLNTRTLALMDIWAAFDAVVEQVEQQQLVDPTWNSTPSSSMFVTALLTEIGKADLAMPSVEFLQSHWELRDGRLEIDTTGLATVIDFQLMQKEILAEDDIGNAPEGGEPALTVDMERFHRSWLAGLILGAEAATAEPKAPRDQLAEAVELEQLPASGAFYPQRVPWCTARILLGLAACGRSVTTSERAARAAEWLLHDRSAGGGSTNGMWLSGTGGWNSSVETTALVLLALVKAGIDPADARLERGRDFLLSERDEWKIGFEGAAAIEALLVLGTPWEELAPDAARVSGWALDTSLWQRATLPADEILAQTCHVAQAATHLVEIGWTAIKSDLPALLQAVDLPSETNPSAELAEDLSEANEGAKPSSGAPDGSEDASARLIASLDSLQLGHFRVVGDYARFDERSRHFLRDRYLEIEAALETESDRRDNFLIWAPPGSGKTYFVQQVASSLGREFQRDGYRELNLADLSKEDFLGALEEASQSPGPTLCVIDEVDGRSAESWPYEELFSALDLNIKPSRRIAFVLIGSGGKGLHGLMQSMEERPKGKDLLDRIPDQHRFEIPAALDEDRLIVFAKQAMLAASSREQDLREVDRVALYYVLKRSELASPRQCAELAKAAVGRMQAHDDRLRYEHLFRTGDPEMMEFYARHITSAQLLSGTFTELGD